MFRVVAVLEALKDVPEGLTLPQVATAVELAKSSALRYLISLESAGYVDRDPENGRYRLGLAFLGVQQSFHQTLAARLRPYLETARDRFGETINFGLLDGNRIVYVDIVESRQSLRLAARAGDRAPVHSTAIGKAIASRLSDESIARILRSEGMARRTSRTITSISGFLREIEATRKTGFAIDHGEDEEGSRCVAVALPSENLLAAISLSAPEFRFSQRQAEDVARVLTKLASEIVADLNTSKAVMLESRDD